MTTTTTVEEGPSCSVTITTLSSGAGDEVAESAGEAAAGVGGGEVATG